MTKPVRILTLDEAVLRSGLRSKGQLYRMVRANDFPQPIPVSDRASGFLESEVEYWIEQRIARREQAWAEHPARLNCLVASAASTEARRGPSANAVAAEIAPVKRPRGRPRKYPAPADTPVAVKRGRGRPRKAAPAEV
jgi:predicted DNA-binding transcriptional regulator AlpA